MPRWPRPNDSTNNEPAGKSPSDPREHRLGARPTGIGEQPPSPPRGILQTALWPGHGGIEPLTSNSRFVEFNKNALASNLYGGEPVASIAIDGQ